MVPKGVPPTSPTEIQCPITGRPLQRNWLNGYLQPVKPFASRDNPAGLNERIIAAGYNPDEFMVPNGAIPVLAYVMVDGQRVARIEPARDRGRFGGWQIVPDASKVAHVGIIAKFAMPDVYKLEWCV